MFQTKYLLIEGKEGLSVARAAGWELEEARLPKEAKGLPVTEIAPYAFSDRIEERERRERLSGGFWVEEDGQACGPPKEGLRELGGESLERLFLPAGLKRIGRYAFYNCRGLRELSFSDSLKDIGAGAFTGCHRVKKLEVRIDEGEGSLLRDVLMELPEKIQVELWHRGERARLFFPEYFEEGVENTPARILENHVHGSGLLYRNCFYKQSLNLKEYDRMFQKARAWEEERLLSELSAGRLLFPLGLSEEAAKEYRSYLEEHFEGLALGWIQEERFEELSGLLKLLKVPKASLLSAIERASELDSARGVGLLMDYRGKDVQAGRTERKRRFEL